MFDCRRQPIAQLQAEYNALVEWWSRPEGIDADIDERYYYLRAKLLEAAERSSSTQEIRH